MADTGPAGADKSSAAAAPTGVGPGSPADPAGELDEPSTRGRLVVKDRVANKIAVRAAVEIDGVVRRSTGLSRLTGRELPRALAIIGSDGVAVGVHIAVAWPSSIQTIAAEVQERVHDRVQTLLGMPVSRVDVAVAAVVPRTGMTAGEGVPS